MARGPLRMALLGAAGAGVGLGLAALRRAGLVSEGAAFGALVAGVVAALAYAAYAVWRLAADDAWDPDDGGDGPPRTRTGGGGT